MSIQIENLTPSDLDQLVSTVDAAAAAGVHPQTVRQWKARGKLDPSGLDKYNRPLYKLVDVLRTEKETRYRR
ncbi:hypothetical protein CQ010_01465 [Arthrobacter sp. MYb211]|uniref:hypothetical protein n=1 Tax=unclassified Arthrobacter TaxID=235627 RepID=UPI000CFB96D5|nr:MULTISPECIES: hypothetical protein [unclassified Arthrobacter]PRA13343.1 hypothetical protein CQ015_03720 [Arthrobacter sp. MYb221]PRC10540.1 hypothetical protein CQ010_01465 [Arthrobacter sp. MYb211]